MSNFINTIKAAMTGVRRVAYPLLKITVSDTTPDPLRAQNEYEINVLWSRKVYCKPEHLSFMLSNCVRELREEIYGDLKSRILRLERAVYEQDSPAALREIRDIIREVYES